MERSTRKRLSKMLSQRPSVDANPSDDGERGGSPFWGGLALSRSPSSSSSSSNARLVSPGSRATSTGRSTGRSTPSGRSGRSTMAVFMKRLAAQNSDLQARLEALESRSSAAQSGGEPELAKLRAAAEDPATSAESLRRLVLEMTSKVDSSAGGGARNRTPASPRTPGRSDWPEPLPPLWTPPKGGWYQPGLEELSQSDENSTVKLDVTFAACQDGRGSHPLDSARGRGGGDSERPRTRPPAVPRSEAAMRAESEVRAEDSVLSRGDMRSASPGSDAAEGPRMRLRSSVTSDGAGSSDRRRGSALLIAAQCWHEFEEALRPDAP